MLGLLVLVFPGGLLLLLLAMERVEAPLRVESVGDRRADRALPRAAHALPVRAADSASGRPRGQRLSYPERVTQTGAGHDWQAMIALLALGFPGVLLVLMLAMERVEAPLRDEAVGDHLVDFLESARPEEVERFVSQGLASALDRYWSRRSWRNRLAARRLAARS